MNTTSDSVGPAAELAVAVEAARRAFAEDLAHLSRTQARTPIGPGKWSPVEYVEHLVRAEEATIWRMFTAVEDARASKEGPISQTPDQTIEEITDRTWGGPVESPPLAVPQLRGSLAYWLLRLAGNGRLVEAFASLVSDAELNTVAYNHPISGPFTMRQGLDFCRFHLQRHHEQLKQALDLGPRGA